MPLDPVGYDSERATVSPAMVRIFFVVSLPCRFMRLVANRRNRVTFAGSLPRRTIVTD